MSVVAKFKVQRVECSQIQKRKADAPSTSYQPKDYEDIEMRTVILVPVYGNGDPNHENTKFWDATPTGEIKLGTVNPSAWQYFKLGGEYLITFEEAPQLEGANTKVL